MHRSKEELSENELGEDPRAYEVDEMTESDVNHALLEIAIDKQMRADEETRKSTYSMREAIWTERDLRTLNVRSSSLSWLK